VGLGGALALSYGASPYVVIAGVVYVSLANALLRQLSKMAASPPSLAFQFVHSISIGLSIGTAFGVVGSIYSKQLALGLLFPPIFGLLVFPIRLVVTRAYAIAVHLRLPILESSVAENESRTVMASIAHVSDLHVTGTRTIELGHSAKESVSMAARVINDATRGADWVVLTGDVTDTGSEEDWQRVFELWRNLDVPVKVLPIPGNHDLLLHQYTGSAPGLGEAQTELRARRWTWFYRRVAQPSWACRSRGGRAIAVVDLLNCIDEEEHRRSCSDATLQSVFNGMTVKEVRLAGIADSDINRRWFGTSLCDLLFPVLFTSERCAIIGLNSCRRVSKTLADNAVGALGDQQLQKLAGIIAELPRDIPKVILTHHHVGIPSALRPALKKALGFHMPWMAAWDSKKLLSVVSNVGPVTIAHGHKHFAYSARYGDIRVVSAPSALFGDVNSTGVGARSGRIQVRSAY